VECDEKDTSKYAAYTSHLAVLPEDSSVKRSKLKGYCNKWVDAKYILGCAVFLDFLSPCVILSKVMQYGHMDILAALSSLSWSIKEIEKLNSLPVDQWPTYALTISKCTANDDNMMYQAQTLKRFDVAESYFVSLCTVPR